MTTQVDPNRADSSKPSPEQAPVATKSLTLDVVKGAVGLVGCLVILTLGVLFCILVVKMSVGAYSGTRNWWHSITTTTPEERAAVQAADAEWAKDPLNPDVIAQKCLDAGGYPKKSSWDGSVTCNDKGGSNKNVNVEVHQ